MGDRINTDFPEDFPTIESYPDEQDFVEAIIDWEIEHDIEKDYP